jgi:FAD/FMN-containing dehydrogenase
MRSPFVVTSNRELNDVHSKLNHTRIVGLAAVQSVGEVCMAVRCARDAGLPVAIAGGRHAMGGQQFVGGGLLVDTRDFNRILHFDPERGEVEVEAGIQWPRLMRELYVRQRGLPCQWGIRQKQTGADKLSIGGAVAANIHGRGLNLQPFSQDLLALDVVDAEGRVIHCSREENAELFCHVIGGYGLFGVVVRARLKLAPRQQLERVVVLAQVDELPAYFETRIRAGHLYGDFQFATDPGSGDFLRRGILSCYRPLERERPIPPGQIRLSHKDWAELLHLAHADKRRAYEKFTEFYLASSGQLYWSDTHQLNIYLDDYHAALDARLGAGCPGSEAITELYVPLEALPGFMADCRAAMRARHMDLIYGTVRLIRRDTDSRLAWARQDYACVIFNLHAEHRAPALQRLAADFRLLIDLAIARGGSYFLTYHRHARRDQVLACYPQFPDFLRAKLRFDPEERFQSDWYRHYRAQFADLADLADLLGPGGYAVTSAAPATGRRARRAPGPVAPIPGQARQPARDAG